MSSRIKSGTVSLAETLAKRAAWRVRFAKALGLAALLFGLVIFGAFLFQSGFFSNFATKPESAKVVLDNPDVISGNETRISGVDKDNKPFEIFAIKGVQDKNSNNLVHLQGVSGVFLREGDSKVNLTSNSALYDTKAKVMAMDGKVVIEDPGRFKAQMEKANLDLDNKNLVSQSPVHVDMATGSVDADNLEILDSGKRSLFKGHVKARFETDNGEEEGKGDGQ